MHKLTSRLLTRAALRLSPAAMLASSPVVVRSSLDRRSCTAGSGPEAVAVGEQQPGSIVVGLFINSLNEVIDLHRKRLVLGVGNRIPGTIWGALDFVALLATAVMGYHTGLSGSGRSLAVLALVLAFSLVMAMIIDLDRPQEGFLRVGKQAMIELQQKIGTPGPRR